MNTRDKQPKEGLGTTKEPDIEDFKTTENQTKSTVASLKGNGHFEDGRFKEAVKLYTEALEASKEAQNPDPRLLINRATALLRLENYEECLQDSDEYIHMLPNCWKGHIRKALALKGLKKALLSACSAAIAYYHDADRCRRYEAFHNAFKDTENIWAAIGSSESLRNTLTRNDNPFAKKKILLLQGAKYEVSQVPRLKLYTSLVALTKDQPAMFRTELLYISSNCCFENINFGTKDGVLVPPGVKAEFDRCKFHCASSEKPAIQVGGTASFVKCEISNSKGGGIIVGGGPNALASFKKCRVFGNGATPRYSSGIRVYENGTAVVQDCVIYGNSEGIHIYGSPQYVLPKEVKVTGCEIYDNKFEGIIVVGAPNALASSVTIQENKIYQNGGYGVRVSLCVNDLLFQRNIVFENAWWGIWVQCNSGGKYKGNQICNNKMGGLRAGKQSPEKIACVIENNVIHDNGGPAFHEELRYFEGYAFPVQLQDTIERQYVEKHMKLFGFREGVELPMGSDVPLPVMVTASFKSNNQCFQNGIERDQSKQSTCQSKCSFCFRLDVELEFCDHCGVTTYCGKECQALHWKRHKYVCQAAGQRNFIDVCIPIDQPPPIHSRVSSLHPGLESTNPTSPSPPPKDGGRFIVKLQTHDGCVNAQTFDSKGYTSNDFDPQKATVIVYDHSRSVEFEISDRPKIYYLILEYGILGASLYLSKKLYCWAAFKDDETLRIFTRDFPAAQNW